MEKQQTAVDWLVQQINGKGYINVTIDIQKEIIEQAKQMEWEQLCDAWMAGVDSFNRRIEPKSANDYYNKTFNR